MTVSISGHFDLVFRKDRLSEKGIAISRLCELLEAPTPRDQDDHLLSFGPHFGGESVATMIHHCELLGLTYGDDFYDFDVPLPSWCKLRIQFNDQP